MSAELYKRPDLSEAEMAKVINKLADNGISIMSSGSLKQNASITLYPDGHFFDFGSDHQDGDARDKLWYGNVNRLLELRPSLIGAPVQASKYSTKTATRTEVPTDFLNKQCHDLHDALIEFYDLEEQSLLKELDEFLPADWFKDGFPDLLGYAPGNTLKTLSVSALDKDNNVHATCYRRTKGREDNIIKWKTDGTKTFIPSKLTGKNEVYLASGMGELVMLEILGVDYIILQADGMVTHLTDPKAEIQHLIILPDNDDAFMKRVGAIQSALKPKKASMVKWKYSDPREAALALKTMDLFMDAVDANLEELKLPEVKVVGDTNIESKIKTTKMDDIKTPVLPENYRFAMENRWLGFGQTKANGMDENWLLFATAMNNIIYNNKNKDADKPVVVIAMATGESKTQGSIVYASELYKADNKIRAMIVVKLNKDASNIAEQINELGGKAIDFNSDSTIDIKDAAFFHTVVVSHEFFKNNGYVGNKKWDILSSDRDLFLVDEALHNVNASILDLQDIERLKTVVAKVKMKHIPTKDGLVALVDAFDKELRTTIYDENSTEKGFMRRQKMEAKDEYLDSTYDTLFGFNANIAREKSNKAKVIALHLQRLDKFIQTIHELPQTEPFVCMALRISQHSLEWDYRNKVVALAEKLQTILAGGMFSSKKGKSITGVRELIPNGVSFGVLDATAPVNMLYALQSIYHKNIVMVPIKKTRNYNGFDIAIANTVTGAKSLTRELVHAMMTSINEKMTKDNKLLVIVHKIREADVFLWLKNNDVNAGTVAVNHYGNITGKNDWRDFDSIAVIGLFHKPDEFYQALNIVKTDEETAYDNNDGISNHTAIKTSDLASDLAQAMARIRIRNINDENGGCLPARAWITVNTLPVINQEVKSSLKEQFSGASYSIWDVPGYETQEKFKEGYESTISYLDARMSNVGDEIILNAPRDDLNIQADSYKRLMKDSIFLQQIDLMGIEIHERSVTDKYGRVKKILEKYFAMTKDAWVTDL